jgi:hypothetical protein
MTRDELVLNIQRILFEEGPLSINEIRQHLVGVTKDRIASLLSSNKQLFEVVGWLKKHATPPQHIWGLLGDKRVLAPEPPKKHPFDLPKHSIIYRDMVAQQRVRYEKY